MFLMELILPPCGVLAFLFQCGLCSMKGLLEDYDQVVVHLCGVREPKPHHVQDLERSGI